MDFLDSRQLTGLDGFYHRFMLVGTYGWGIGSTGQYVIDVTAAAGAGQQHTIVLEYDQQTQMYQPNAGSESIAIRANDYVLWHLESTDPSAPRFSIVGSLNQPNSPNTFNSRSLGEEDAFSHLFSQPGDYKYVVSGGAGGKQSGEIQVQDSNGAKNKAVVVKIIDGQAPQPPKVKVISGDTVHWDVDTGSGLAIMV